MTLFEAMEQFAFHYPERRDEVIGWMDDLLQFYIDNRENEDILDATMTSYIEYSALNLRAVELLPKLKILHETDSIDEMMCGDYADVEEEMHSNSDRIGKQTLPAIYTLAENEKRFMENTYNTYKEEERKEEANALISSLIPDEEHMPKVGRNEPCPCGSGKKFKKCCGG